MANVYSFDLDKGTDWSIPSKLENADCSPRNLTGATFEGKIRQSFDSVTAWSFTFTVTNALGGEFTISLSNVTTSALPTGLLVYDIEMLLGGLKTRILEGQINARAEVTT
jgi:hypothetical protein